MAQSKSRSRGGGNRRAPARRRREHEDLPDYSLTDPHDIPAGPDVLLDVPVVKVDTIDIEVDDLRAQVAVMAEVRDLVEISVGADVGLGKVELKIEGVEAQALLKARLDNVSRILQRVLTSLDRNPELLASVGRAAESVGEGGGELAGKAGEAAESVGEGAEGAVRDVGGGAGKGVAGVGKGARGLTQDLSEGGG